MGLQHFPSLKCAPWAHFHGNTSAFALDTVAKPMRGKKLWHSPFSSRALRSVATATRGTESMEHPDSLTSHGQVKMSNGRIWSHQSRIYCYIHVTLANISIMARFKEKQRQLELPLLVLLIPANLRWVWKVSHTIMYPVGRLHHSWAPLPAQSSYLHSYIYSWSINSFVLMPNLSCTINRSSLPLASATLFPWLIDNFSPEPHKLVSLTME